MKSEYSRQMYFENSMTGNRELGNSDQTFAEN